MRAVWRRQPTWKRAVAAALAGMLVFAVSLSATAAAAEAETKPEDGLHHTAAASDTAGHWASAEINRWVSEGWIGGYEDGTVRPDAPITRAELASLINRRFAVGAASEPVLFADLPRGGWQYGPLSAAAAAGYIRGYEDGTVRPNAAVTRQELTVMLHSLLRLTARSQERAPFADDHAIASWSREAVTAAASLGLVGGYEDGTFRPTRQVTRAEAVVILERAAALPKPTEKILYDAPGTYGPEAGTATVAGNVEIHAADVVLRNTIIRGDLLLGENIGEGDVTLSNVTVTGKTHVKGGGANSVHLENSTLVSIVVERKDGVVRIVASGTTSVGAAEILSAVNIEETEGLNGEGFVHVTLGAALPPGTKVTFIGDFDKIEVAAKEADIEIAGGTVAELDVKPDAGDSKINVGADATVSEMKVNAPIAVTGPGKVTNAVLAEGAGDTTFEQPPDTQSGPAAPEAAPAAPAPDPAGGLPGAGGLGGGGGGAIIGGGGGTGGGGTTAPQPDPELVISTAVASGARKLTVTFGQPVNMDKLTISVKKNTSAAAVQQVAWSDDRLSVTVELLFPLSSGDYDITLVQAAGAGVERTYHRTVTAANESPASLTFLSDTVVWNDDRTYVKMPVQIHNQYGEEATEKLLEAVASILYPVSEPDDASGITASALPDDAPPPIAVSADGRLHAVAPVDAADGDSLLLAVRLSSESGWYVKKVTLSDAEQPATSQGTTLGLLFDITGLYHPDDTPINSWSDFGQYRILLRLPEGAQPRREHVVVVSSRPNIMDVKRDAGGPILETIHAEGGDWFALTLEGGPEAMLAAPFHLTVIEVLTGQIFSVAIPYGHNEEYEVIASLDIGDLSEVAAAGENILIPIVARNLAGSVMKGAITIYGTSLTTTHGSVQFLPGADQHYIELDARNVTVSQETPVTISATLASGQQVTKQLQLMPKAVPTTVNNAQFKIPHLTVGAFVDLREMYLQDGLVLDQYGRNYPNSSIRPNYWVEYTSDDFELVANTDFLLQASNVAGTTEVQAVLVDSSGTPVPSSGKSFSVRIYNFSDLVRYETEPIGLLYAGAGEDEADNYAEMLKIWGIDAEDNKVEVSPGACSIVSKPEHLHMSTGQFGKSIWATDELDLGGDLTGTVSLTLECQAASGTVSYPVEVEVSKEAPWLE